MAEYLKKLYLLMIYSKFEYVGRDHLMFDDNDRLCTDKLGKLILQNEKDNIPIIREVQDEDKTSFKRPSLKLLNEIENQ